MALQITSAIVLSPSSSLNCINDFPKLPSSALTQPSKSSISNLTNNLLPPLSSYPPMSPSEIDHQYIPTDPLYLPRYRPEWPFCLGEDISRMGAGTRYIGITAWDLTLTYISLHQDTTLSHYSQPFLPDDVIDPEMRNVLKRCMRIGRVAWLLWKEIVLLFKSCAPQWWLSWFIPWSSMSLRSLTSTSDTLAHLRRVWINLWPNWVIGLLLILSYGLLYGPIILLYLILLILLVYIFIPVLRPWLRSHVPNFRTPSLTAI